MSDNTVLFDRDKLARLRVAYNEARSKRRKTFKFDDHKYLVAYAKYLIQYLEGRFEQYGRSDSSEHTSNSGVS